jgi:hypothetical protein
MEAYNTSRKANKTKKERKKEHYKEVYNKKHVRKVTNFNKIKDTPPSN